MSLLILYSSLYFLCLLYFGLFTVAEGKDSQQGKKKKNKQQRKKMQTVRAIVYFFKMVHMSASLRNGGRVLLHLPFFDKYTHQPCVFSSPSPSFHRSFALPLWFLLWLSLNVRWEEAAGIIGHASVGLFDHVTRLRLHTYVPLNKPSNVAPEAEHGSKGSRGTCAV